MSLIAWFLLLVVQNAAFTWVSRARNSGSLGYHAVAAVFSNGVWFASNIVLIGLVAKFINDTSAPGSVMVVYGAVYIAGTVTGSVLMHYVSMRWFEKGKRKVGS